MFGLFRSKGEKAQRKLLEELEAAGAAQTSEPGIRRRHAHLVHILRGDRNALPLYESIAAACPENRRTAMLAASIRLDHGDDAAVAAMEEVARARPSLAAPAYHAAWQFLERHGPGDEAFRVGRLFAKARMAEEAAKMEGRFDDPGGPVMQHGLGEEDLTFVRFWVTQWLGGLPGLASLLAGSRILDDGAKQMIFVADTDGSGDNGLVDARLAELASIHGDFLLYVNDPEIGWLREELESLPGSRIYP